MEQNPIRSSVELSGISQTVKPEWSDRFIPNLAGGLNSFVSDTDIEDNQLTASQNMRAVGNVIIADHGYKEVFVGVLNDIFGGGDLIIRYRPPTGNSKDILVSLLTALEYGTDRWTAIAEGANTTIAVAAYLTPWTSVQVADTAGFAVNDIIRIRSDTATDVHAIITAIPTPGVNGIMTLLTNQGEDASIGLAVTRCVTFTGGVNDRFDWTPIPWDEKFILTNNVDPPKVYDYASNSFSDLDAEAGSNLAATYGASFVCDTVSVFNNQLILGNCEVSGTRKYQRIIYSDAGDLAEFATGVSGFVDLYDSEDIITKFLKLGPYLIIYRSGSLHRMFPSEAANKQFEFEAMIEHEGLFAGNAAVAVASNKHIFWGNSGVYEYEGGFDIVPIHYKIRKELYGASSLVDETARAQESILFIKHEDEICLIFQGVEDSAPKTCYRYNLITDVWSGPRTYDNGIKDAKFITPGLTSPTWDDLVGNWEDQNYAWTSSTTEATADTFLLMTVSGAFNYTGDFFLDDEDAIEGIVATKDFQFPQTNRIDWLDIVITGGDGIVTDANANTFEGRVLVEYSEDEGNLWTILGYCKAGVAPIKFRLYKQFIVSKFRIRLRSYNRAFSVHNIGFRHKAESEQLLDLGIVEQT